MNEELKSVKQKLRKSEGEPGASRRNQEFQKQIPRTQSKLPNIVQRDQEILDNKYSDLNAYVKRVVDERNDLKLEIRKEGEDSVEITAIDSD